MESDREPTRAGGFYAPVPSDTRYVELGNVTVDGETFTVRRSDDGATHHDWISGPNDGYGFSTFGGTEPIGHARDIADIRDFLAAIDPATGYL